MSWQASVAFSVTEFVVLAVGGRPALDGMLVEVDGHFALLSDGSIHSFDDAVSGLGILGDLVGSRIWVTGSMDDPPFTYGIIA